MANARSGLISLRVICHRPKPQWLEGDRIVGRLTGGTGHGKRRQSTNGSFQDLVTAADEAALAVPSGRPQRLARHARPLPVSPSYFTRQPRFNDSYVLLQDLFRKYGKLPAAPADKLERVAWRSHQDYQMASGESVKASHYNT